MQSRIAGWLHRSRPKTGLERDNKQTTRLMKESWRIGELMKAGWWKRKDESGLMKEKEFKVSQDFSGLPADALLRPSCISSITSIISVFTSSFIFFTSSSISITSIIYSIYHIFITSSQPSFITSAERVKASQGFICFSPAALLSRRSLRMTLTGLTGFSPSLTASLHS